MEISEMCKATAKRLDFAKDSFGFMQDVAMDVRPIFKDIQKKLIESCVISKVPTTGKAPRDMNPREYVERIAESNANLNAEGQIRAIEIAVQGDIGRGNLEDW